MKKNIIIIASVITVIVVGICVYLFVIKTPGDVIDTKTSGDEINQNIGLAEKAVVVPISIKENASGINRKVNAYSIKLTNDLGW